MPVINDLKKIEEIAGTFNVIPIVKDISGDMETPVSIFSAFSGEQYSFFFESAEGAGKWGRFSFICINPYLTIELSGKNLIIKKFNKNGLVSWSKTMETPAQDIFSFIKELLSGFRIYKKDLPDSFTGGLFGYLGYEVNSLIEKLPPVKNDITKVPDLFFMLPRNIIIYDSLEQKILVISMIILNNNGDNGNPAFDIKTDYDEALIGIDNIILTIRNKNSKCPPYTSVATQKDRITAVSVYDEVGFDRYKENVLKAKEYIRNGDIFQVQVSRRKKVLNPPAPFLFYRALRLVNPSPYMFYLKIDDFVIAGSSPENLVKLSDNIIEIRPIAGTIKRGNNMEEDELLATKLLNDPKERAEHVMLVDLGRNDIGRVSKNGSVKVNKLMYIERYSHVQHIVTSIISEINENYDGFDLIKATFPAGTVSGAPKIRAMEIINELEDSKRGVYAGGVGYFSFLNNNKCDKMEFCITIRTALFKNDACYIQAAGGIVYDSTPENEFLETENKLKHLIAAMDLAKELD